LPAPDETGVVPVEVDPLLAETGEDFRTSAPPAPQVHERGHHYTR
jgi:hypothetical protein